MALAVAVLFASLLIHANGQLSSTFYDSSCRNLTSMVRTVVQQAVQSEPRMAASLLRLHFHDCFVNGCDASILLTGLEQDAAPNQGSVRGFGVIDNVKSAVEGSCPGVVSCADILALAAHEAVRALNGPSWVVKFGRRDSTTASASLANSNLPPPTADVPALITFFSDQNLSVQDMVALSGGHTIGQAQCRTFRSRLYAGSDPTDQMDTSFNTSLRGSCPQTGGDSNLSPLDLQTPIQFDNLYFQNLQSNKGLLFSDQVLYTGGQAETKNLVDQYANSQSTFFNDFASAMVKMGDIEPLTGSNGQIRTICSRTN